jgi:protein-disulfide isomerase
MRSMFALAAAVCVAVVGCKQDNGDIKRELAGIRQDIQALRAQLGRGGQAAAPAQPPRPDPAKVYAVATAGAPAIGPEAAPLTVVMAYEYACPWCSRQQEAFTAIRGAYGDDVRFVYRPFVVHEEVASDAAVAACAAERQGRFAEVNEALWKDVFAKRAFDRASVERVAGGVPGIDAARLRTDMDGECRTVLARERDALSALGVNGTPQVWVNGRPVPGGFKSLDAMKPLLDEELARARERIAAGTPRGEYYAEWVMKKGLPRFEVARN